MESLGTEFVGVNGEENGATIGGYAKLMSEDDPKAQRESYARQTLDAASVITTTLIPGLPDDLQYFLNPTVNVDQFWKQAGAKSVQN